MITVLSGGTGTPKLLQGLKEVIDPKDITIVVNTLENEYFSGVYVSADIDTVLYTMADMINEEFWYGVKDDTFITHERLEELGTPELLRIGDIDRATKIQKTLLMENHSLAEAVDIQANNMHIHSKILPMSNENSDIKIITDIGELEFHDFLIKHQCNPEVLDVKFSKVTPAEGIIDAINNSDAVIIGHRPNHPYREPRGIEEEIRAIEAVEPTKVVGISINLKNAELDLDAEYFEHKYNLPVEDVYNNGASKLLDAIFDYLGE